MSTLTEEAAKVRERELVQRVAQAMANEYGHGQAWKCMAAAKVAVRVMGEVPAKVPVMGEPVAWRHEDEYKEGVVTHRVKKVLLGAYPKRKDVHTTPLYLAPTTSITAQELDALRGIAKGGAMLGHEKAYEACLKLDAALTKIIAATQGHQP